MSSRGSKQALPEGTVTFLFTDIEGSTELLKRLGDRYADLLEDQRKIVRACFEKFDGQEVDTQGDSFFVSFPRATQAVSAAIEIQQKTQKHEWPEDVEVRLRMGLHTGEPLTWAEGYVGIDVHRAARIAAVGHGGQILLSQTTTPLIKETLPEGISLIDLGRHRLKDLRSPERIGQIAMEGMPSKSPPLTSLERLPDESPIQLTTARPPSFLEEGAEPPPRPTFVARENELAWLSERLDRALAGEGQIAFVTGGPGRGKSALLEAFMRKVVAENSELLAVRGESSAHTGVGDPYQPFRGAIGMLLGDLEGAWASGLLDMDGAQRLWETMPRTAQLLLEVGPDLLDVFVSGRALLARLKGALEGGSSLLEQLGKQVEAERPVPDAMAQRNLFEQFEGLLIELTAVHPLILVLDDLQWSDTGSINLLFHLERRLKGRRLLILGAYRPEEVTIGRGDEPHPLEKLLTESKRLHGEITLDLGEEAKDEGRAFVDALIDSEPNELGEAFRQALAEHTGGHPLFTVELLRAMQERGDLVEDAEGRWVEGEMLEWNNLPARVEGVIEERIGRLEEELRETLTIASVEGETFTAQVVAQVQDLGERKLLKRLSQQLEKQHRLIHSSADNKVGEKLLSLYRFSHALYQRYLYNELSVGERRMLHRDVAEVLESFYEGNEDLITVQLGHHWEAAGDPMRAETYLQLAGDQARLSYAHETAASYYQRAIEILIECGEWDKAARSLMKLGLTYQTAFEYQRARDAFDEGFTYWNRSIEVVPSPEASQGETIRLARLEPRTLDPGKASETHSSEIIKHLFCGLVELTPDLSIAPELADSWEVSEDGRRMVFHLADDIRWSDGVALTAMDFEYAWKRNLHPNMYVYPAQILYEIVGGESYHKGLDADPDSVGVKALDEHTLEVELARSCGYFLYLLAHNSVTFPLPRHSIEAFGKSWTDPDKLVCNGPYILTDWVKEKTICLNKNPFYHRGFRGNLERIEIKLEDLPNCLKLYEANRLDEVQLTPLDFQDAKAKHPNEYIVTPIFNTTYILFNLRTLPLDDLRVRRAIALATDRETWNDVIYGGFGLPAKGGLIPIYIPGSLSDADLPFDPVQAVNLLAEAGYPAREDFPTWTLLTSRVGIERPLNWLINQWNKILGIKLKLEYVDWDVHVDRIRKGEFSLALRGWSADYPDPDSFLRTNVNLFQGGWVSPEFMGLIDRARSSRDQEKRVQLYQEADLIIIDQVPVVPIGHERAHRLLKPWVRAFPVSPMNTIHAKDIIVEPH